MIILGLKKIVVKINYVYMFMGILCFDLYYSIKVF